MCFETGSKALSQRGCVRCLCMSVGRDAVKPKLDVAENRGKLGVSQFDEQQS